MPRGDEQRSTPGGHRFAADLLGEHARAQPDRDDVLEPVTRAEAQVVLARAVIGLAGPDQRVLEAEAGLAVGQIEIDTGGDRVRAEQIGKSVLGVDRIEDLVLVAGHVDERRQATERGRQPAADAGAQVVAADRLVVVDRFLGVEAVELGLGLRVEVLAVPEQ
jgi:hypothetical protein